MTLAIIKTITATLIATLVASFFQLNGALTAGIIAMLSLQETLQSTLVVAMKRLISAAIALLLATFIFYLFGFSFYTWTLFLMLFTIFAYVTQLQIALVPSCVLVSQLYMQQTIAPLVLFQSFLLLLIGTTVASLCNSYMPTKMAKIISQKQLIETYFQSIFSELAQALLHQKESNALALARQLQQQIQQTEQLLLHELENRLFNKNTYELAYLDMRKRQLRTLFYMIDNIQSLSYKTPQQLHLATLFESTASQIHEMNSAEALIVQVKQTHDMLGKMPLPKTRQEFESRAILFQLLTDLSRFLIIKNQFVLA